MFLVTVPLGREVSSHEMAIWLFTSTDTRGLKVTIDCEGVRKWLKQAE